MNYLRETVQEHSTHEISKGHNVGRQTMFPVVFSVSVLFIVCLNMRCFVANGKASSTLVVHVYKTNGQSLCQGGWSRLHNHLGVEHLEFLVRAFFRRRFFDRGKMAP